MPYQDALGLQESIMADKHRGDADDVLLLVEHPPVYTLGRGADEADLQGAPERLGVPVFRVGRGGGVTFHGPGQLVAYPIVTLRHGGRDVRRYVRNLEQMLLDVCAEFGIPALRREGQPGLWAAGGKIASIGIGVRRWTTFHGIALNVSTDVSFFQAVVPCRMPDLVMTSMALELGQPPPMARVKESLVSRFRAIFGYSEVMHPQEVSA